MSGSACTARQIGIAAAAFRMAVTARQPRPGLIHHSDRGIQYAATAYQQLLAAHRCRASMSRPGDCRDHAVVDSRFRTLKQELGVGRWPTRSAAQRDVVEYVEHYYNPVRLHSTPDYQSPVVLEAVGVR
jgi:transposase InsO family protein